MRSSKDLAKRLRFDLFPRKDFFRRRYRLVGTIVAIAGVVVWVLLTVTLRQRQYLPGPVSQNHATFGVRCEVCHTSFQNVGNAACEECHGKRVHSTFEQRTPECRDCHVEHRGAAALLTIGAQPCVECHGTLVTTNPHPLVQTSIATFAAHPQFTPLREGVRDGAALLFNHKLHLTSDKIVNEKLKCASCHEQEAKGRLMRPIVFATHCQRCHKQEVTGVGEDGSDGLPIAIEALHATPELIRPDLMTKLAAAAVDHPEIFEAQNSMLPGIRTRAPADASRTLQDYRAKWIERLERELYQPFQDQQPLLEHNKRCFLCHVQKGTRAPGDLPIVVKTGIPARWLTRGEFSHRRHELLPCATCHGNVERSSATADTNLPPRETCQQCHVDGSSRSAGTTCMTCHLYHDTSKDPLLRRDRRKEVRLETIKSQ